jgi:hypothetical protein
VQNDGQSSPYRFVVDESSFNFRGLSTSHVERALDDMMDALKSVRTDAGDVAVAPLWDGVRCLDECELSEFLSGSYESGVSADTRRRAYWMMSKCPEWDEQSVPGVGTTVSVDGGPDVAAWSVEYALGMTVQGRGTACMVFPAIDRRGFLPVADSSRCADIFFFAESQQLPEFWRSLFILKSVVGGEFFSLGALAFPQIVLHPDLSFQRFDALVRIATGSSRVYGSERSFRSGAPQVSRSTV